MSAINEEFRAISDATSETLKALLQMAGIFFKPEEHGRVRKLAQNAKKLFNATLDNRNLSLLHKGQRTGFVSCTTEDKSGKEYTAPMKLQLNRKGIGEDGDMIAELNAFQIKATPYVAPEILSQLSEEKHLELITNKFLKDPIKVNFKGIEKEYIASIDPDLNITKLRSLDAVRADIKQSDTIYEICTDPVKKEQKLKELEQIKTEIGKFGVELDTIPNIKNLLSANNQQDLELIKTQIKKDDSVYGDVALRLYNVMDSLYNKKDIIDEKKLDATIDNLIAGGRVEHIENNKPSVAFYDVMNFRFATRPISVDKALNFDRTVWFGNATKEDVTANYRQSVVIETEGKNGTELKAFMVTNVAQGVPIKELFDHIANSSVGKLMKIQGLSIEEALKSGVKISIKGNDHVDKIDPNKKYILDLKQPDATVMRKAHYEAKLVNERAELQIDKKQHLSLEAKDLNVISTKVIDEKTIKESPPKVEVALSNEQLLNHFVTSLQGEAKKDAHNMSYSDDFNVTLEGKNILALSETISADYQTILKESNGVIAPNILKDLTQAKYKSENLSSMQLVEQNFKSVISSISNKQETKVKAEQVVTPVVTQPTPVTPKTKKITPKM